jgi:hypothetical protein
VPIPIEWLVGPVAALALALVVIGALYRLLKDYIADIRAERDAWKARSLASDDRLERLADAFEAGFKKAAPK